MRTIEVTCLLGNLKLRFLRCLLGISSVYSDFMEHCEQIQGRGLFHVVLGFVEVLVWSCIFSAAEK